MRNKKTIAIIVVMCMLMSMAFSACTKKETGTTGAKTIANQTATIKESGWSYDSETQTMYYAVTVHNDSTKYVCSGAEIEVTITTSGGGKEVDSFTTCRISPKGNITAASVGMTLEVYPSDVSFKIDSNTSWEENDGITRQLDVVNRGVRYPEYDTGDLGDIDVEWGDIFEGDDLSVYEQEYTPEETIMEYYGTISNPNEYEVSGATVYVVFRDGNGNLRGGDSIRISDPIPAGGTADFSILLGTDIRYSIYEVYAYVW